ncbi:hypothetical protein ACFFMM_04535 [Micromonospora chaiyaphumensis]|uniref:LPXTG-motif cell wall anchor domain-containing protein n=1 Tax=Micromonospora chaiyaphumensis TaxID=307119 RepID=A0A1C4V6J5_9ACTN|nr:hypothetical protein [Micromonospora chaiyaphumensis]SCE79419.1 hypothetical protein GA0070214_10259 [Micromonospora chaiyaphumensis]
MSVRRHAARWATVGAMLGGLLAGAASPALAADDRVEVRSASRFTAGASAGTVAVEVRKRTDGCVLLRTALGLRLDGLRADQVQVQVATGGRWVPVPVSGGGGAVATAQTSPANAALCKGKGITVRYRVAFLAGTVGGRLTVAGEASAANGRVLGRSSTAARVVGAEPTASPSPTPSRKPSPTPTPSAAATTPAESDTTSALAAALDPAAGAAADDSSSGGSPIMWFGIALVLVGVALIVLLVRRNRAEKTDGQPGAGLPPVPLPRSSTTYRSGAPAGPVYGQQPPAPAPRPTGNVYGAPTATTDRPDGEPPAAAGGDATTVLPRVPR